MTDKTKREATCSTCHSTDPKWNGTVRLVNGWAERNDCADSWHTKPPATEKAEWDVALMRLGADAKGRVCVEEAEKDEANVRAAVQRAIQDAYGEGVEQGVLTREAAAAEARARKS